MLPIALSIMVQMTAPLPAEVPVAPYAHSDANAGATPFAGTAMWHAFHGQAGVDRIIDGLIDRSIVDKRISDIFKGQDMVRLRRTLKEQFCYILAGGCGYSGRTMHDAHANMGIQDADMAALVEKPAGGDARGARVVPRAEPDARQTGPDASHDREAGRAGHGDPRHGRGRRGYSLGRRMVAGLVSNRPRTARRLI